MKNFYSKILSNFLCYALVSSIMVSLPYSALANTVSSQNTNANYVSEYYDVTFKNENITINEFINALTKVSKVEIDEKSDEVITYKKAVSLSIIAAELKEVALTYPKAKIESLLSKKDIPLEKNAELNGLIAVAVETGIADVSKLKENKNITKQDAAALIASSAEYKGLGRRFIGTSKDTDIYSQITYAYDTFKMPKNDYLVALGNKAVKEKIITGYNIRDNKYDSRFEKNSSLRYGHSDLKHALQLVSLLKLENINALVNVEPKVSAFEYLIEWGPVPEKTDSYYIDKQSDDFYIAFALEYDLVLEFSTKDELNKFDDIVKNYAKKNTGEEDKALISGSWWQPFYSSRISLEKGYKEVSDNVIGNNNFTLHTTSLTDKTNAVQDWFKGEAIDKNYKLEKIAQYVNDAFFRYLNGESE